MLFIVLPLNISDKAEKVIEDGNDTGAPNNPQIFKKFLITTIISIIIWSILIFGIAFYVFNGRIKDRSNSYRANNYFEKFWDCFKYEIIYNKRISGSRRRFRT